MPYAPAGSWRQGNSNTEAAMPLCYKITGDVRADADAKLTPEPKFLCGGQICDVTQLVPDGEAPCGAMKARHNT
jgi:hypothetical protein